MGREFRFHLDEHHVDAVDCEKYVFIISQIVAGLENLTFLVFQKILVHSGCTIRQFGIKFGYSLPIANDHFSYQPNVFQRHTHAW